MGTREKKQEIEYVDTSSERPIDGAPEQPATSEHIDSQVSVALVMEAMRKRRIKNRG